MSLTLADLYWPDAEWIVGRGDHAVLAHCNVLTITLHRKLADAKRALRTIALSGCGSRCTEDHELVDMRSYDIEEGHRGEQS